MSEFADLFEALAAEFPAGEVKTRNQGGRSLAYIQAHTVMDRLDAVVGPENWWTELIPTGTARGTSWLCKLSIRLPDGSILTKQDVGSNAGMTINGQPDTENDDKSGASDAIKRAAVHFGIARYLRGGGAGSLGGPQPGNRRQSSGHSQESRHNGPPQSGKALFAWVKAAEERHGDGLLNYLNEWASAQGIVGRMVEWNPSQVARAHAEALAAIERFTGDGAGHDVHAEAGAY